MMDVYVDAVLELYTLSALLNFPRIYVTPTRGESTVIEESTQINKYNKKIGKSKAKDKFKGTLPTSQSGILEAILLCRLGGGGGGREFA